MNRPTEISPDAQGMMEMFDALEEIRTHGVLMSGRACAELAGKAMAECKRLRREANPIPIQDISGIEAGTLVNQPSDVLYTLAVMENGDAKTWTADKVSTPAGFNWLHDIVQECAAAVMKEAAGPAGLN